MSRRCTMIVITLLFSAGSWLTEQVQAQTEATPGKRRVYVLHSGMHIILAPADKNQAVVSLKQMLRERGIPSTDIVPLDCPYPTASWSDVVPRDGLLLYLASADPGSRAAQEAYQRL